MQQGMGLWASALSYFKLALDGSVYTNFNCINQIKFIVRPQRSIEIKKKSYNYKKLIACTI